jgi:hypothetical protein
MTSGRLLSTILLALALAAAGLGPFGAQSQPFDDRWNVPAPKPAPAPKSTTKSTPTVHKTQQATAKATTRLPVGLPQALYLIRSALLTLNDANRSGNYTVLRDLAAPDFQARNRAADLAATFANLRARGFDLFAVALVAPRLSSPPALDTNRMLRLVGAFPTRPLQIEFNLLFQNVGGQWRLYDIAVATPRAAPVQSAVTQPHANKN